MSKTKTKNGKPVQLHPYKDTKISIRDFTALPECTYERRAVTLKIKNGISMDQIAACYKDNSNYKGRPVGYKNSKKIENFSTDQAKAIMSTPINVKYTSAHYMQVSYIGSGEQTPTALTANGYMGRV